MTQEEKAKAYDEAIKIAKEYKEKPLAVYSDVLCKRLFPELVESEDEKTRNAIFKVLSKKDACEVLTVYGVKVSDALAWLEKQKDASKAIEDSWHKVADSFPDSTREVICKDAIGNFFIGRYYKGSNLWEVSMYDDVDKSNEDSPPVVMWCDIPSEKQKEQKDYRKLYEDISKAEWLKKAYVGKSLGTDDEQKPAECADDVVEEAEEYTSKVACGEYGVEVTEAYIAGVISERNRGTKWSEEDKEMLDAMIDIVSNSLYEPLCPREGMLAWLKSLRPQPKRRDTYYDIIHDIFAMLKDKDFTQITPQYRVSLLNDIRVKCKNATVKQYIAFYGKGLKRWRYN